MTLTINIVFYWSGILYHHPSNLINTISNLINTILYYHTIPSKYQFPLFLYTDFKKIATKKLFSRNFFFSQKKFRTIPVISKDRDKFKMHPFCNKVVLNCFLIFPLFLGFPFWIFFCFFMAHIKSF